MANGVFIIIGIAVVIAVILFFFISRFMFGGMSKQMQKMTKNMMSDMIDMEKSILDEHEEDLKEISARSANIEKEAIEIKARAIKDGLTKDEDK